MRADGKKKKVCRTAVRVCERTCFQQNWTERNPTPQSLREWEMNRSNSPFPCCTPSQATTRRSRITFILSFLSLSKYRERLKKRRRRRSRCSFFLLLFLRALRGGEWAQTAPDGHKLLLIGAQPQEDCVTASWRPAASTEAAHSHCLHIPFRGNFKFTITTAGLHKRHWGNARRQDSICVSDHTGSGTLT